MKLFYSLLICAALGTQASLNAQQSVSNALKGKSAAKSTTKKTVAADPEAAKAAKEAKAEEKQKVHLLAAIEFKYGRETGDVLFELFPDAAPKTVENFRSNVESGYYNGLAVHRAVKDYLVQTGDSASRDDKARETWGLTQERTIPGEFKRPHVVGAVAMARRGDNVNPDRKSDGSQFYFVLGNMSALDGQYTVFGEVVSGMPLLKKISRSVTDSNDCPVVRIEIKKIKIVEQSGPLVTMTNTSTGKHKTTFKPDALKGPFERFIDRIW
ncbi:MAG: peptidylprolyl isomerase [Verrucomicrobia bacterium]|nr:peptidylprolyl isomerase [Verrucomicrobiota bacterium]